MRKLGFSSGAVAYGDFKQALITLRTTSLNCIEMSALRTSELPVLLAALPSLNLSAYEFVSLHAPSRFTAEEELEIADLLFRFVPEDWPIVLHPDAIHDYGVWRRFGSRLAIENMDRRKPIGRSARELECVFQELPEARLCFDIGHARQFDPSMTEAFLILSRFAQRLAEVHVSEVNTKSQHDPVSYSAKLAFQQVAKLIPQTVPIIIESRVDACDIPNETSRVVEALIPR